MIKKVTLYTANYAANLAFYQNLFKDMVTEIKYGHFRLSFRDNELNFMESSQEAFPPPFYHFAFRIPFSLFAQAKEYITRFVELNVQDGQNEISFRPGIRSCYFYDPSGNVVEIIGNESTDNDKDAETFSVKALTGLVEISLVTNNLESTANQLHKTGILKKEPTEVKQDGLTFIPAGGGTTILLAPLDYLWVFSNSHSETHPQKITLEDYEIIVKSDATIEVNKIG